MGLLTDLLYPIASTWLSIGAGLVALVALFFMLAVRSNRAATGMVVIALSAAVLGYGSFFTTIEKDHDERMASIDAAFEAEMAESDRIFLEEMERMQADLWAKHERVMRRVNARADRVLQQESERLGVPVETIDPRITGNWERWTYKPSTPKEAS